MAPSVKASVKLAWRGHQVSVLYSAPSVESVDFMWTDGNYACDCNRSILAREASADWPELSCGNEIEVVSIDFEED